MDVEALTGIIYGAWNNYCPTCGLWDVCHELNEGCEAAIRKYAKDKLEQLGGGEDG